MTGEKAEGTKVHRSVWIAIVVIVAMIGWAVWRSTSAPLPTGQEVATSADGTQTSQKRVRVVETRRIELTETKTNLENMERTLREELHGYAKARTDAYLKQMIGAIEKTRRPGYKDQIDKDGEDDFLDWLGGYANGYSMVFRALIDKFNEARTHLTDKDAQTAYLKKYVQDAFETQVVKTNSWGQKYEKMVLKRVKHAIPESQNKAARIVLTDMQTALKAVAPETTEDDPAWISNVENALLRDLLAQKAADAAMEPAKAATGVLISSLVIRTALGRLAQHGLAGKVSAQALKFSTTGFAEKIGMKKLANKVATKAASLTSASGQLWHWIAKNTMKLAGKNTVKLAGPAGLVFGLALDYTVSKVMAHYGRPEQHKECEKVVKDIAKALCAAYIAAIDEALTESFAPFKEKLFVEVSVPKWVTGKESQ